MELKCLELIKNAASRLGIVSPLTIEGDPTDAKKLDSDALILLASLNEAVNYALTATMFIPQVRKLTLEADVAKQGNGIYMTKLSLPKDFLSMVATPLYVTFLYGDNKDEIVRTECRLISYDALARRISQKEDYITLGYKKDVNLSYYSFLDNKFIFLLLDKRISAIRLSFDIYYQSNYSIINEDESTSEIKASKYFSKDNQTSFIDDELLILGTVMNYRLTLGIDDGGISGKKFENYSEMLKEKLAIQMIEKDSSLSAGESGTIDMSI